MSELKPHLQTLKVSLWTSSFVIQVHDSCAYGMHDCPGYPGQCAQMANLSALSSQHCCLWESSMDNKKPHKKTKQFFFATCIPVKLHELLQYLIKSCFFPKELRPTYFYYKKNEMIYLSMILLHDFCHFLLHSEKFKEFKNMRGVTWAYSHPSSTSGVLTTLKQLKKMGESVMYFGHIVQSGVYEKPLVKS